MRGRTALCCFAALACGLLLAGCEVFDNEVRVLYRVDGTASQIVATYRTEFRSNGQRVAQLPFEYEADFREGDVVGVLGESLDPESVVLTCEIYLDGELLGTSTDEGVGAAVSCSGVAEQ